MKVLVTGGAGFIGSHITDTLIEKGNEVIIIDNLSTGLRENINPKAPFHLVDITKKEELKKVFQKENIDYVVHAAANSKVRVSRKDSIKNAKANIIGSLNVIDCCRKFNIKKVIYLSTGNALYGDLKILPAKENFPIKPLSNYGISKYVVESLFKDYFKNHNLDFISLRLANVYGGRDTKENDRVIPSFINNLIKNKSPIIFGNGLMERDFIYVGDVSKAVYLSLNKKTKDKIFNIGSGKSISVNELLKKISNIMGIKADPLYIERNENDEVKKIFLNIEKAKEQLNWYPKTDFNDGLIKTIDWHKRRIPKKSLFSRLIRN